LLKNPLSGNEAIHTREGGQHPSCTLDPGKFGIQREYAFPAAEYAKNTSLLFKPFCFDAPNKGHPERKASLLDVAGL